MDSDKVKNPKTSKNAFNIKTRFKQKVKIKKIFFIAFGMHLGSKHQVCWALHRWQPYIPVFSYLLSCPIRISGGSVILEGHFGVHLDHTAYPCITIWLWSPSNYTETLTCVGHTIQCFIYYIVACKKSGCKRFSTCRPLVTCGVTTLDLLNMQEVFVQKKVYF